MHEFSFAQSLCQIATEEASACSGGKVVSLTCKVGAMQQLVPDLLQTAFKLTAEGTPLEGAELTLEVEGIDVSCASCGECSVAFEVPYECPKCGSTEINCTGGQDFLLTRIEISEEDDNGGPSASAAGRKE